MVKVNGYLKRIPNQNVSNFRISARFHINEPRFLEKEDAFLPRSNGAFALVPGRIGEGFVINNVDETFVMRAQPQIEVRTGWIDFVFRKFSCENEN